MPTLYQKLETSSDETCSSMTLTHLQGLSHLDAKRLQCLLASRVLYQWFYMAQNWMTSKARNHKHEWQLLKLFRLTPKIPSNTQTKMSTADILHNENPLSLYTIGLTIHNTIRSKKWCSSWTSLALLSRMTASFKSRIRWPHHCASNFMRMELFVLFLCAFFKFIYCRGYR